MGRVLDEHGLGPVGVSAVASHDTASAFAAAPLRGDDAAILSSGTWSLLGVELAEPTLDDVARGFNFTNERGVDGTRLLTNVMGLWLLQECGAPGRRRARPSATPRCSSGRGGGRRATVRPRRPVAAPAATCRP